jgi:proline iminopeptidase
MIERTSEIPLQPGGPNLFSVEVRDETTPADAPVAVVLHGGPGASLDYLRPQLDGIAGSHRLLYYDQRGGGRSLVPDSWPAAGITEHLADLRTVLTTLEGPPVLVGYSWGGLLALSFALEAPELIRRLLLVAPAPPYFAARERMRENLAAAAQRPDVVAFAQSIDRSDRRQRFAASVAGYFVDPRRALELTPFMVRQRAERGVWDSLAGYDLRPRLPSLAVPTLILHGVEDPIPVEASRETAKLTGCALVELPHCGHSPYIEGGDVFFEAARAFVNAS